MEIKEVPLDQLKPDPANARKHSDRNIEEIIRSLKEFGQHAPLVVQKGTNRIIVGNGRYEAMQMLGWDKAYVVYVDDDNVTAVRRALADNRTAELAEWDDEALARLLEGLGDDLDVPGWSEDELRALVDLGTLPEVIDNSYMDNRTNRTASGYGNMIIAIGTLSILYDRKKTLEIIDAILEGYGEEKKNEAMERFCEWLYENRSLINR